MIPNTSPTNTSPYAEPEVVEEIPTNTGSPAIPAPLSADPSRKKSLVQAAIAASKQPGGVGSNPVTEQRQLNEATDLNEIPVVDSLLGREVQIGKFSMRPITLATISLLKEIDSPLIQGLSVEEVPNIVQNVLELILIQQVPLREAAMLVKDPTELRLRCLELGEGIQPDEVKDLISQCTTALQKATSGQVSVSPSEEAKDSKNSKEKTPEGNVSSRHG